MSRSVRSELPKLPQISCYHAEIHVQRGEEILTLEIPHPDFAPEEEVLREAASARGAETVGDLVAALEKEGKVRIEPDGAGGFYCRGDREIYPVEKRLA